MPATASMEQVNPADTESSLTPQELGQTGKYTVQLVAPLTYGYRNVIFEGRRCRWFWVPSTWGEDPDEFDNWWDNGRWVRVCGRRHIPWWWFGGEWADTGAYALHPPRLRPTFPRAYFARFRHNYGGGGYGRGPGRDRDEDHDRGGYGGPNMGRGPTMGGGPNRGGEGPTTGDRGPNMGGGGGFGHGPRMGGGDND
jgi:hypothetical protein